MSGKTADGVLRNHVHLCLHTVGVASGKCSNFRSSDAPVYGAVQGPKDTINSGSKRTCYPLRFLSSRPNTIPVIWLTRSRERCAFCWQLLLSLVFGISGRSQAVP